MPPRFRRLRATPALRRLVAETELAPRCLVQPLFVDESATKRAPIRSMPGQFRYPVTGLAREASELHGLGVPAVILFGIPRRKDSRGSPACAAGGVVQQAVRRIKRAVPELIAVTDVCLCEYTDHGHCGVLRSGRIANDETLKLLAKTAVSHAEAGADIVAPSAMMDGQVGALRAALDDAGFHETPIMSYSSKYASAFYGPFREAARSAPASGDRRTHQMDFRNAAEALREVAQDVAEGADIVMVKPALPYLDIIRRVKERFPAPLAAFQVSGEYTMVKAAARFMDERALVEETLTAIRRAGADIILTYFAREFAESR